MDRDDAEASFGSDTGKALDQNSLALSYTNIEEHKKSFLDESYE